MPVSEYDANHGVPMHRAIAKFVDEVLDEHPDEGFDGTFGYRIDVYRADGSAMPFIYVSDDRVPAAE